MSSLYSKQSLTEIDIDIERRFDGILLPLGSAVEGGLNTQTASSLGLREGLPVSTGIVDGYGGLLSTIMSGPQSENNEQDFSVVTRRLSMITGTSAVYISLNQLHIESPGFCGPWPSVFNNYQLNVIRQTAAGALLDFIITSHPAYTEVNNIAISSGVTIYHYLGALLLTLSDSEPLWKLTSHLHVLPYFAGNHCPRMDMSLRGMITGLTLDKSEQSLALLYLATIQSLALGARHNIETLAENGLSFDLLMPAGGLAKNPCSFRNILMP